MHRTFVPYNLLDNLSVHEFIVRHGFRTKKNYGILAKNLCYFNFLTIRYLRVNPRPPSSPPSGPPLAGLEKVYLPGSKIFYFSPAKTAETTNINKYLYSF